MGCTLGKPVDADDGVAKTVALPAANARRLGKCASANEMESSCGQVKELERALSFPFCTLCEFDGAILGSDDDSEGLQEVVARVSSERTVSFVDDAVVVMFDKAGGSESEGASSSGEEDEAKAEQAKAEQAKAAKAAKQAKQAKRVAARDPDENEEDDAIRELKRHLRVEVYADLNCDMRAQTLLVPTEPKRAKEEVRAVAKEEVKAVEEEAKAVEEEVKAVEEEVKAVEEEVKAVEEEAKAVEEEAKVVKANSMEDEWYSPGQWGELSHLPVHLVGQLMISLHDAGGIPCGAPTTPAASLHAPTPEDEDEGVREDEDEGVREDEDEGVREDEEAVCGVRPQADAAVVASHVRALVATCPDIGAKSVAKHVRKALRGVAVSKQAVRAALRAAREERQAVVAAV